MIFSLNTLRLWLPQIFQAINDFQYFNNGTTSDLCEMLKMIKPSIATDECIVVRVFYTEKLHNLIKLIFQNLNNSSVYINSIIVASVSMFSYFLAGYLINILGKKKLLSMTWYQNIFIINFNHIHFRSRDCNFGIICNCNLFCHRQYYCGSFFINIYCDGQYSV